MEIVGLSGEKTFKEINQGGTFLFSGVLHMKIQPVTLQCDGETVMYIARNAFDIGYGGFVDIGDSEPVIPIKAKVVIG